MTYPTGHPAEADVLMGVRAAAGMLHELDPNPVVEVRVTQLLWDALKARARRAVGRPTDVPGINSIFGIPAVVDDTLPPVPGYRVVRKADYADEFGCPRAPHLAVDCPGDRCRHAAVKRIYDEPTHFEEGAFLAGLAEGFHQGWQVVRRYAGTRAAENLILRAQAYGLTGADVTRQ